MDIALGIGNTDPLGIKLLLNFFRRVKIESPVIIRRCPGAGYEIHTAVSKFSYGDKARRVVENSILFDDVTVCAGAVVRNASARS